MRYAQINNDGLCYAESNLSGIVKNPALIPLEKGEPSRLGWVYSGGEWTKPAEPAPEPEPISDTELMLADIMLQQAEIKAAQREQDETLAAILLAQMEG